MCESLPMRTISEMLEMEIFHFCLCESKHRKIICIHESLLMGIIPKTLEIEFFPLHLRESIREKLYALRKCWEPIFPPISLTWINRWKIMCMHESLPTRTIPKMLGTHFPVFIYVNQSEDGYALARGNREFADDKDSLSRESLSLLKWIEYKKFIRSGDWIISSEV